MFYEVWKSGADLEAHFQTPHMLAISKLLPALREGPLDLDEAGSENYGLLPVVNSFSSGFGIVHAIIHTG